MKIFISSTCRDLKKDREILLLSLRKANFVSHGMEFFAATPNTPKDECLQQVASSDLVILIIGDRYGSIDEDTNKAMTQLEYERAEELNIPVLAFMKQLPPNTQVDEKFEAFRSQVLKTKNISFFEDTLSLMCSVWPSLFNYLSEKGMIVRRMSTFQFWEEYIRPFLDPAKLFNHKHQFVGREEELRALDTFLSDQPRRIAVVSGSGGVGKSKLIYEFINRSLNPDWDFRFVSPHIDFDVQSVQELPSKNICVVIEDAHKRADLDKMVAALMRFPYWDKTKVIISTRPSGEPSISHALSTYDPQEVEHIVISPLDPRTHSFELAKATLSTGDESLARSLVRASDGNCLVITVGGTLIKERKVDKSLLEDKHFKNIVLDKLLEDLEEGVTSTVCLDITEVLATIAGVGPVVITSEEFQKNLSEDLNVEWHELSGLIDQLENKGLILRRGRKIRVIPDVLADHILLKHSVNTRGEPTKFIDKLFSLYGTLCFSNILSNVAEIEFNTSLRQQGSSLLRNVWNEIDSFMKDENTKYDDLSSILDKLCPAAIFAPHNTLELCKWLIHPENLIKPSRESPLSRYIDAQTVLEKIPPLLRRIGWHPTYTTEVCEILWNLANTQLTKANVNPYPQHPFRLLQELASLDNHNYFSIVENTLVAIENIISRREHHSSFYDIQEVLENTLGQEVENTSSDRRTFTLSWTRIYSCKPKDRIRSIRRKALKLLEILATDDDPKTVLRTSQSLLGMLSISHRGPDNKISEEEIAELTTEAEIALEGLSHIIRENKHPNIANELKSKLRSKEIYVMKSIKAKLEELVHSFDSDDLYYQVQYCMSHEWPEHNPDEDLKVSQKKFEKLQEDTAKALWTHVDDDPKKFVEFIKEIILNYGKAGVGCEARSFQHACAKVNAGKASEVINLLLGEDNLYLAVGTGYWFFYLNAEQKYSSAKQILAKGNKNHKRGLAAYLLSLANNSREQIVDVSSSLAHDPDKDVRYSSSFNLAHLYERRNEIKEILDIYCDIDVEQDADLLNHLLSSIGKKHGINPEDLSNQHIEQLLANIESVKKLSHNHYWIGDFLDFCRNKNPRLLVELFLRRIEKDVEIHKLESAGGEDKYQPFPYLGFNYSSSTDITNHPEFENCLQLILEATKEEEWEYSFWCPKIFQWLDHNFSPKTQQYLSGVLQSADAYAVVAIATLLKGFDPGMVFVMVDFVCLLLVKSHELGNDCYKSVCSILHGIPFTGTHAVSPPGEPDHHHLAIAQSCEATMKRQLPDPAREFYESVKRSAEYYAKQKTEEDRLEEEEEGM